MSQSKRSWPEDPDALVRAEVLVPARLRRAYDEDPLRGKFSHDIRMAMAPRIEANGYGLEEAHNRFVEKREALFRAQTDFNAARDHYYGMLEHSLAHQKEALTGDKEKDLIEETISLVRERYGIRQREVSRMQVGARDSRRQALDWCTKQIRDTPVLKERFLSPEALLKEIEKQFREKMEEKGKPLYPNVDFFSGAVYSLLGIPKILFTSIFAMARVSGWLAHILEQREHGNRIYRPESLYKGPQERTFTPIGQRA